MVPTPAGRSRSSTGVPVIRRAIRGANAGSEWFARTERIRGRGSRSGCQASPNLTVRRIAASLWPPTQTGIGAVPSPVSVRQASRRAPRYSSASRPRAVNGTPSASNS
ncbi:hypothetical protein SAV31267_092530 [Streptomyces avermitilis]|uniref:Uncharacterized protein n=1 Tax=Streptomyces avermitilis TaxID=33903 RepID=A0A4D4N5E3_STRAX|nr:hypothetical protein SAV31267_092530 [Streptomyces avermitilis]